MSLPEETPRQDRLRFHDKCGSLVKLSSGHRSAERRRPLDEFNNGVVMTHRPLKDSELFEIRIDRLVDKWSGSIEVNFLSYIFFFRLDHGPKFTYLRTQGAASMFNICLSMI